MRIILLTILVLSLLGCAGQQVIIERTGEYKVLVGSNGELHDGSKTQLVHRRYLQSNDIDDLFKNNTFQVPCDLLRDANQQVVGVQILEGSDFQKLSALALEPLDVITAVGKKRVYELGDVYQIFENLKTLEQTSLTLQRNGNAHKVYYFLTKAEKPAEIVPVVDE